MSLFPPKKKHIDLITNLVKLGCNESDICLVLDISEAKLQIWKNRSKTLSDLLKPKARPEYTMLHPDYAHMVEEAFTCAGKRFYRMKEEYRMSTGRYKYYYSVLRELELKLSLADLEKYMTAFKAVLNGGKKNKIEFTELTKLVLNLESRLVLAFDTATIKKLAAVAYFDESEDLLSFNEKYGEKKIALWEENKVYDFFLTKPIGELFNLKSISVESLQEDLNLMDGVIQETNFSLQQVLEDNL